MARRRARSFRGPWRRVRGAALLLGVILSCLAGCASSQAFTPAAHVTALSPDGRHDAAEYELSLASGQRGGVRVWSDGAYREEVDGTDQTLVHVGFAIDNNAATPLRFDERRLQLEDVSLKGGSIDRVAPLRIEGNTTIGPSQSQRLDVVFRLPQRPSPGDVRAYRVVWAVTDGGEYVQRTPFLAIRYRRRYDYDPYLFYYRGYPWPYYSWPYYGWPYDPWLPGPGFYQPGFYQEGRLWRAPPGPVPIPRIYARPRPR